jgi:HlyD family secretion protein
MGFRMFMHAETTPTHFAVVSRGDVDVRVTESGGIEALKHVEVKSKVGGRIAKLLVQEGDRVRAGQLLAEIDPTEINSQVEQMRAQLDATKARYEQSLRGVSYQKDQTHAGIDQNVQALRAAEARLKVAEQENASQPSLTASDIAQAEAGLKSAQDSLTMLKNSTHPQAVVAAESGFDDAKANAEHARRNLERQQRLFDKGFVSEQVVDNARAEMAASNARRDQAKKRLDLISEQNRLEVANAESHVKEAQAAMDRAKTNRSLLNVKKEDVAAAQAAVKQARTQLELSRQGFQQNDMRQDDVRAAKASVVQLENQLREVQVHQGDTHLIANMDGVVTQRYIEEGELVTSGTGSFSNGTPVLRIADLSQMLVKISVNEVDVHKVRVGLPVEITIDGAKGAVFKGRVSKVAPAAVGSSNPGAPSQPTPGANGVIRFAVEVVIDRPDSRMKPGMTAKCAIFMARRQKALRLPADAVQGDGSNATVQILTQAVKEGKTVDTYTPRKVVAGLRGDSHIEIISGLKEGEKVKPGVYSGPARKGLDMDFK